MLMPARGPLHHNFRLSSPRSNNTQRVHLCVRVCVSVPMSVCVRESVSE